MKNTRPNVLIVSPNSENTDSSDAQDLAGILAQEGWVYFAERDREGVEDSEAGVRFLRWEDTLLDHFGRLEAVVVVDDRNLAEKLSERCNDVPVILWDRNGKTVDSAAGNSLAHVESFNRASQIMPLVENFAFSSFATS